MLHARVQAQMKRTFPPDICLRDHVDPQFEEPGRLKPHPDVSVLETTSDKPLGAVISRDSHENYRHQHKRVLLEQPHPNSLRYATPASVDGKLRRSRLPVKRILRRPFKAHLTGTAAGGPFDPATAAVKPSVVPRGGVDPGGALTDV